MKGKQDYGDHTKDGQENCNRALIWLEEIALV